MNNNIAARYKQRIFGFRINKIDKIRAHIDDFFCLPSTMTVIIKMIDSY